MSRERKHTHDADSIIAFMSSNPDLMCIADTQGRFVKVSHAWEEVFGYAPEEMNGKEYVSFVHPDDVDKTRVEMARFQREGHQDRFVNRYRRKDGSHVSLEWHSHLVDGLIYASARDVTLNLEAAQQVAHDLAMKEAHLSLMTAGSNDPDAFLKQMLDLALASTSSQIGYVFLYDEQSEALVLQAWSQDVLQVCHIPEYHLEYQLRDTGLWGEVVRTRAPVMINDYSQNHSGKKGLPEGHAPIRNFLSIPIMPTGRIVALMGVANRSGDYSPQQLVDLSLLANTVWPVVERIHAEAALRREKELLSATLQALQEAIIVLDVQGRITHMNRLGEEFSGMSLEQAHHLPFEKLFQPFDPDTGLARKSPVERILTDGERNLSNRNVALRGRDGVERRVSGTATAVFGENGLPDGLVVSFRDNTLEYQQQQEIDDMLYLSPDAFCVIGSDGHFIKANPRFEEMLGYPQQQLASQDILTFIHPSDRAAALQAMAALREQKPVTGVTLRLLDNAGAYRHLEWNARPIAGRYVYATARDATETYRKEKELRASAVQDALTGCYNRFFLDSIKDEMMNRADRYGESLSIILTDLDHFKRVNDTFGHPVGDDVLRHVSQLLMRSIRSADFLIRIGGEEFLILMPQTASGAARAAEKLRAVLEKNPHPKTGTQTGSFGVVTREIGESFESLYKRADAALYEAKNAGRNRVVLARAVQPLPGARQRISWDPSWECGHPLVDEQHRQLVVLGNTLLDAVSKNGPRGRKTLSDTLEQLVSHIQMHFADEEQLMCQIGYPERDRHSRAHEVLVQKARLLAGLDGTKRSATYAAILTYLLDEVIVDHMKVWDVLFFPYVGKHKKESS